MEQSNIILTSEDRAVLDSFCMVADGIGDFCGESSEVIVHSLETLDHSVIKIINGYRSNRQVGSPISNIALSFVNQMRENPDMRHSTYFAKNKRGENFKSTISAITNKDGTIIGLFSINFYLDTPLSTLIQLCSPSEAAKKDNLSEIFTENSDELMIDALTEAKRIIFSNMNISSSNKNKEIITLLYNKGIFNLKDSVITIADNLGISKNTVYMHIRNINQK